MGDDTQESKDYILMVLIVAINYAVDMLLRSNWSDDEKEKEISRIIKLSYVEAIVEINGFDNTEFGQKINEWFQLGGKDRWSL